MFRTYVPVQGFDECSFCRTVRTLPWLVVDVVPVHVVNKTSEASALFAAEDKDDNYDNDYVNNDAVVRHVQCACGPQDLGTPGIACCRR